MAAHLVESRAIHALGSSPDVHEGVAAFLEKRVPDFPMRVSTDLPDFFGPDLFAARSVVRCQLIVLSGAQ